MRARAAMVVLLSTVTASAESSEVDAVMVDIDGARPSGAAVIVEERDVWVPAELLCAHRICRDGTRVHDAVRYVSLAGLAPEVMYTLDRGAGELHVTSAARARTRTTIDLALPRPSNLETTSATSLFVNYAITAEANDVSAIASEHSDAGTVVEAGLSIGGALVYSTAVLDQGGVVRGLSNASVDLAGSMIRASAGDELVTSGTLGSSAVIGGVHLRRDFAIDPYFVSRPTFAHSGVVETPSTIEVYRGGQIVRRETIAAGPYTIEDVVGNTGTDAQVVVRDAFGMSRATVSTLVAPPAGLLAPGLSSFDYSAGFVRHYLATSSGDYGELAGMAIHRRGITPRLTLGARAEASRDVASAGAMALGQLGHLVSGAASLSPAGASGAAALNLGWQRGSLGVAVLGRYAGARYATLELSPSSDRVRLAGEASITWSPWSNTTLLALAAAESRRDTGERARLGFGANLRIGEYSLLLAGSAGTWRSAAPVYEATATLLAQIGSRTSINVRAGYEQGRAVGAASIGRAVPSDGGVGYQLDTAYAPRASLAARGVYLSRVGRAEASAGWAASRTRASRSRAGSSRSAAACSRREPCRVRSRSCAPTVPRARRSTSRTTEPARSTLPASSCCPSCRRATGTACGSTRRACRSMSRSPGSSMSSRLPAAAA